MQGTGRRTQCWPIPRLDDHTLSGEDSHYTKSQQSYKNVAYPQCPCPPFHPHQQHYGRLMLLLPVSRPRLLLIGLLLSAVPLEMARLLAVEAPGRLLLGPRWLVPWLGSRCRKSSSRRSMVAVRSPLDPGYWS